MRNNDTVEVFNVFHVPVIKSREEVSLLARQMGDLYRECVGQVLRGEEVRFHIVKMPDMTGLHYVYGARNEEDEGFIGDIEKILGVEVKENDCVVLLGREMLSVERNEDEMMEIVLMDIAVHLDRLWPVADVTTGWIGHYIGRAAIAAIIASAHDVLKMLTPEDALVSRIKDMAGDGLLNDNRIKSPQQETKQNRPAFDAIDLVCEQARETQGCYLTLPVTARQISNTAKSLFLDVVGGMKVQPRGLI